MDSVFEPCNLFASDGSNKRKVKKKKKKRESEKGDGERCDMMLEKSEMLGERHGGLLEEAREAEMERQWEDETKKDTK